MTDAPPFPFPENEAVRKVAAEMLWPKILKWAEDGGDNHPEEIRGDVVDCLGDAMEDDGYKLAKLLDDENVLDPDSQLVDVLDNFHMYQHNAVRESRVAWVKATGWVPTLKVGDKVTRPDMLSRSGKPVGTKRIPCVVANVGADEGIYTLQDGDTPVGPNGYLYPHTVIEVRA